MPAVWEVSLYVVYSVCLQHYLFNTHHITLTLLCALYLTLHYTTGKLKNGNSVTLEDGTTITPDMVLGESELKKYFIGIFVV